MCNKKGAGLLSLLCVAFSLLSVASGRADTAYKPSDTAPERERPRQEKGYREKQQREDQYLKRPHAQPTAPSVAPTYRRQGRDQIPDADRGRRTTPGTVPPLTDAPSTPAYGVRKPDHSGTTGFPYGGVKTPVTPGIRRDGYQTVPPSTSDSPAYRRQGRDQIPDANRGRRTTPGTVPPLTDAPSTPAYGVRKPDHSGTTGFPYGGVKTPVTPGIRRDGYQTVPPSTSDSPAYRRQGREPVPNLPDTQRPASGRVSPPADRPRQSRHDTPVYRLPSGHNVVPGRPATFSKEQGDSILHQVNSARSGYRGVDARPIPPGRVSARKDGGLSVDDSRGRRFGLRPNGRLESFVYRDRSASFRSDGGLRTVRRGDIVIDRNLYGPRRIMTVRPDRSVLVSMGPRRGYLQRTLVRNGMPFVQRIYVVNNVTYSNVYVPRRYRGIELNVFMPRFYYAPAFYNWMFTPWGRPVRYSWYWHDEPWYGYYRGYFRPAAVYSSPSLWLGDYLMAETLRVAYQDRQREEEMNRQPVGYDRVDVPMNRETRMMIAREVQRQLALERTTALDSNLAAEGGARPDLLFQPGRIFVVSNPLDVVSGGGEECGLTAGDVLRLDAVPPEGSTGAELSVVSGKANSCPAHAVVTVTLNDLQEMNNSMRERIYSGLDVLKQRKGADGIPMPPEDAMPLPATSEAADLPASNENLLAMLQSQQNEADQAEKEILESAFSEGRPEDNDSPR